jgi:carnitine-CoA ligase
MGTLAAEASLVLIRRFSAGAFREQAVRYTATEVNFIGAVGRILCRRPQEEFRSDHRIETAYGALVTPGIYEHFTKNFYGTDCQIFAES